MMAFTPLSDEENKSKSVKSIHKEVIATRETTNISTDWSTLLHQLKLTGPTLALAQHCCMRSLTDDLLQLTIQPKYAALLNARQQQRIQDALTQLTGRNIKVTITATTEENKMETPAELTARLHDANKQSAKKAISVDPTIQRIVKTFDATVIEDSIEPTH
jgi:DNA polymerase-3 subunit gamma/tau